MTDESQTPPAAPPSAPVRVKRPKVLSRPKRWAEACSKALAAFEDLERAADALEEVMSDLTDLQQEYSEWKDNLPDNLQQGILADKLDTVCDLSLEDIAQNVRDAIEEQRSVVEEAEGTDLPVGFGRD